MPSMPGSYGPTFFRNTRIRRFSLLPAKIHPAGEGGGEKKRRSPFSSPASGGKRSWLCNRKESFKEGRAGPGRSSPSGQAARERSRQAPRREEGRVVAQRGAGVHSYLLFRAHWAGRRKGSESGCGEGGPDRLWISVPRTPSSSSSVAAGRVRGVFPFLAGSR